MKTNYLQNTINLKLSSMKSLAFVMLFCMVISNVSIVLAAVPQSMSYSAVLRDATGTPLSGSYDFKVRYYDASTAGILMYEEEFTTTTINSGGTFFLPLGTGSIITGTFASINFNTPVFITLNTKPIASATYDGEMNPRIPLHSVPYALNSQKLDGRIVGGANGIVAYDASTTINTNGLNASGTINAFGDINANANLNVTGTTTSTNVFSTLLNSVTGIINKLFLGILNVGTPSDTILVRDGVSGEVKGISAASLFASNTPTTTNATLQQVTDNGATTTNAIVVRDVQGRFTRQGNGSFTFASQVNNNSTNLSFLAPAGTNNTVFLPGTQSGTLALSVNGLTADGSGDIDITPLLTSVASPITIQGITNLISTGLPSPAGIDALNISDSIFLGNAAGVRANEASRSNFLGLNAGQDAERASDSNFLGRNSGSSATNARNSNFFGQFAGSGATNANNSTFIGFASGQNDTVDNSLNSGDSSILIGDNTSTGGFSNSIALGANAINTATNQFLVGPSYADFNFRGVNYVFPSAQASTSGQVLGNDGLGNLSWVDGSGKNFASNDLTANGNRIHNFSGFDLGINAINTFNITATSSAQTYTNDYNIDAENIRFLGANSTSIFSGGNITLGASGAIEVNSTGGSNTFSTIGQNFFRATGNNVFTGGTSLSVSVPGFGYSTLITSKGTQKQQFLELYQDATNNSFGVMGGNINPQGNYVGRLGSIYFNRDGLSGKAYLKTSNDLLNTGWDRILTLADLASATSGTTTTTNLLSFSTTTNTLSSNVNGVLATSSLSNIISPITRQNGNSLFATGLPYGAGQGATGAIGSNFFGEGAGDSAVNARASNFFGFFAGSGASEANNSNFFGQNAGDSAINANNSNFFGNNSGFGAGGAFNSNFFGNGAGNGAINAANSNFFGTDAGRDANAAGSSNFFGNNSGFEASNADSSNFFGTNAGTSAINASNSNFFGQNAGLNATDAALSNFFGSAAGANALRAFNSNFFGENAGLNATDAALSNFFGSAAGFGATNARRSIFIGNQAGANDTVNNLFNLDTSILIGDNTNTGGFSNSIVIGANGVNTKTNQFLVGPSYTDFNFRGVNYTFPSAQATVAGQVLTNDGLGGLTWTSIFNGSGTTTNALNFSSSTSLLTTNINGVLATTSLADLLALPTTNTLDFSTSTSILSSIINGINATTSLSNIISNSWRTIGNAGTDGGLTNFVGTTDLQDLVFKTNNVEGMRLGATGTLSILGLVETINPGAALTLRPKARVTAGTGAQALLQGGAAGPTGTGGIARLFGGNGGTVSGNGGNVNVLGGQATEGNGGSISFSPGNGASLSGTARNGGGLIFQAGSPAFGGIAGRVGINGGPGNLSAGGRVEIFGGLGTAGFTGGNTSIRSGESFDGNAGNIVVAGGRGTGVLGNGGDLILSGGSVASGGVQGSTIFASGLSTDTTFTERMRLTPNGNFGIGTSTPSERLDILGNLKFSGALMPAGLSGATGTVLTSQGDGLAPIWTIVAASGTTTPTTNILNFATTTGILTTNVNGVLATSSLSNIISPINIRNTTSLFSTGLPGTGASSIAIRSNFFGVNAGNNAVNANNSNFFGNEAGQEARNASNANFFGERAGLNAIRAQRSNFFGASAGSGATDATGSNFFGTNAGTLASNAANSNFFGNGAGNAAISASASNFFGQGSGSSAENANNSNFFGARAGFSALDANNSNFFGASAGEGAFGAADSNFFGTETGVNANFAARSNFFGFNTGVGATFANNSNFFGTSAGTNATNANQSNFYGNSAGAGAINASFSNFFGTAAGVSAENASNSNFFGRNAGQQSVNASFSNFIGDSAGENSFNASNSNFFGIQAGNNADNANNSIFIGTSAGQNDTVNNSTLGFSSILIGDLTSTGGFSNSIALGAGTINTAVNQFALGGGTTVINSVNEMYLGKNIASVNPLIYANLTGVGIGTINPTEKLQIGETSNTGNLIVFGTASTCSIGNGVGATLCSSDERLKYDVSTTTIMTDLDNIMQLRPVTYKWNSNLNRGTSTQLGLIAQEVERVFPGYVSEVYDGMKGVDYAALVTPLIGSVQELNTRLKVLEMRTNSSITNATGTSGGVGSYDEMINTLTNKLGDGTLNIMVNNVKANKVETRELCLENVCISKAQFIQMLQSAGVTQNTSNNSSENNNPNPNTPPVNPPAPLTCTASQVLNEINTSCIDPISEPVSDPVIPTDPVLPPTDPLPEIVPAP